MMPRVSIFLAALLFSQPRGMGSEWQDLKARYREVGIIAGLGMSNGDLNPNEWNAAEGLPAVEAELSEPHSAMQDVYGRVFVADKNANAIRRIDPDGTIHTVAGMNLEDLPPGSPGTAGFNGDGPARQRLLNGPQHACVMPDGSFYVVDSGNRRIRLVDTSGQMTTLLTDPVGVERGLWVRRDARLLYYCTGTYLKCWTPSMGNGPGTVIASGFGETGNIDVDADGQILVSDRIKNGVYRIPPGYGGAVVSETLRVAGLGNGDGSSDGSSSSGKTATKIGMEGTRGVACHPLGGFFVATHQGGDVWYVDGNGRAWMFIEGNSGNVNKPGLIPVPTGDVVMSEPRSVSVGLSGDVIIACNDAGVIRMVRCTAPAPAAPVFDQLTPLPGGAFHLRWASDPGLSYLVERSHTLQSGDWQPLATLPSAGEFTEFTDAAGSGNDRTWYRLRAFRNWPN